jgi:signal transduction histidine kinase
MKEYQKKSRSCETDLREVDVEAVAERMRSVRAHVLAMLNYEMQKDKSAEPPTRSILQQLPKFDSETNAYMEVIFRNVELELRLVDDLLELARFDQARVKLSRLPIDVRTVLNRAVEACQADIIARHICFQLDIKEPPLVVYADAARVQQLFSNLIKNAVKFTPVGGIVTVSAWSDSGQTWVEISDDGMGIDPEALDRIFEPFQQADRTIAQRFGGLGLGLAFCRGIAKLHGGAVEAHSEGWGKGSTFIVRLPISHAVPTVANVAGAATGGTNGESITG